MDLTLARLRDLYKQAAQGETPELRAQIDSLKAHVRQMVALLEEGPESGAMPIAAENAMDPAELEALDRARSEEFWEGFDKDPLGSLEFLENRIAPLVTDGDMLYMRYAGHGPGRLPEDLRPHADRGRQPVPEGQRGCCCPSSSTRSSSS